jgi:thiol:disulfide interchange protein DsbD
VWLLWVAGRQTSVDTMALALLGLVLLALGLWLWRGRSWQRLLAVFSLAGAAAVLVVPPVTSVARVPDALANGRVAWSEQALARALASGQPVFVDVTADWCITCLANKRAVLDTDTIQGAFRQRQVTYMVADWTDYDANIADFLKRYQRNGIPFYILYSGDSSAAPHILPQVLTRGTVLAALDRL